MTITKTQPTVRAEIIRTYSKGTDFYSAQGLIKERGSAFITNKQADVILNGEQVDAFRNAFPCWVGTGAFYEAPGKEFGSSVEYKFSNGQIIVVEVPKKFHGMKDTALALEHPEYTIEKVGSIWTFKINAPDKIQVVENFPRSDGWYNVHEATGIPTGKAVSSNDPDARYLVQQDNIAWVGPLARGDVDFWVGDGRRVVYADGRPGYALGVVGALGREAAAPQNGVVINGITLSPDQIEAMQVEHSNLVKTLTEHHHSLDEVKKYGEFLRRIGQ